MNNFYLKVCVETVPHTACFKATYMATDQAEVQNNDLCPHEIDKGSDCDSQAGVDGNEDMYDDDHDVSTKTGPRLNIKTVLSTYGDFHVKDKTAVRTSYL